MQHYVMGFAFGYGNESEKLALIEKKKPSFMEGNYNGIGGHVEEGELPIEAMVREFEEETGVDTNTDQWKHTITFLCPRGTIYVYRTRLNLVLIKSVTNEKINIFSASNLPENIMDNLLWLIPLQYADIQFPMLVVQNEISRGLGKKISND